MNDDRDPTPEVPQGKEWTLVPQSEYRFELDPDVTLAIQVRLARPMFQPLNDPSFQLVAGRAEVFGAELALGRIYIFGNECKAAIFTWHGCTIEMSGSRVLLWIGFIDLPSYLRYRATLHRICV